jgi:hypothetical protein
LAAWPWAIASWKVDLALALVERPQLSRAVVDDADGGGKAQFDGPARDHEGVIGVLHSPAHNTIDVGMEQAVLCQQAEFPVEHLQALLRHLVRHHVVDGDLQMIQAGAVETLDTVGGQQVAVGDQSGDRPIAADSRDDLVQVRVQQRLSSADGDDGRSQPAEVVDAGQHLLGVDGLGDVVVFIAISASQVAAPGRDDVSHHGVARVDGPPGDHRQLADPALEGCPVAPCPETVVRHASMYSPIRSDDMQTA